MKSISILFVNFMLCTSLLIAQNSNNSSTVQVLESKIEQNGIDSALEWYKASGRTHQPEAMANLAYNLVEQSKFDEGLKLLKLNVSTFPNNKDVFNPRYMCNIASYLWKNNEEQRAVKYLDLNMRVFPKLERSHSCYGDYYIKQGQNALAAKYYKKAASLNPENNLFQIAFKAKSNTYRPTEIPKDTLKLFKRFGDMNNKNAFVYVQGGPMLRHIIHDNDALNLLPNSEQLLKIYPMQAAMLNPEMVVSIPKLTPEQSDFENIQSAEILHRVISYLKTQGKTVYLIGHSYGASIVMEYLNKHPSQADKIALMGKDFDEDMRSYEGLKSGMYIRWKDGEEPVLKPFFRDMSESFIKEYKLNYVADNLTMMVKTHSAKRFTELLKDKDLSHVFFVHARFDEANGRVHEKELQFLRSKGVTTVETYGDHHSMLTKQFMKGVYDYFVNGTPLKQYTVSYVARLLESETHDVDAIQARVKQQKDTFFPVNENNINALGYRLLGKEQINKAITAFKLNTIWFPKSANVYDSLGEAYLKANKKDLAIKNYEKSLELNPDNPNVVKLLKDLKE